MYILIAIRSWFYLVHFTILLGGGGGGLQYVHMVCLPVTDLEVVAILLVSHRRPTAVRYFNCFNQDDKFIWKPMQNLPNLRTVYLTKVMLILPDPNFHCLKSHNSSNFTQKYNYYCILHISHHVSVLYSYYALQFLNVLQLIRSTWFFQFFISEQRQFVTTTVQYCA